MNGLFLNMSYPSFPRDTTSNFVDLRFASFEKFFSQNSPNKQNLFSELQKQKLEEWIEVD
jgi:hypothetical protein